MATGDTVALIQPFPARVTIAGVTASCMVSGLNTLATCDLMLSPVDDWDEIPTAWAGRHERATIRRLTGAGAGWALDVPRPDVVVRDGVALLRRTWR